MDIYVRSSSRVKKCKSEALKKFFLRKITLMPLPGAKRFLSLLGTIHIFYRGEELPFQPIVPQEDEQYAPSQMEVLAVGV